MLEEKQSKTPVKPNQNVAQILRTFQPSHRLLPRHFFTLLARESFPLYDTYLLGRPTHHFEVLRIYFTLLRVNWVELRIHLPW